MAQSPITVLGGGSGAHMTAVDLADRESNEHLMVFRRITRFHRFP